jgi:hypothetical protein
LTLCAIVAARVESFGGVEALTNHNGDCCFAISVD